MRNGFDHRAPTALRNLTATAALQEASSRRRSSSTQSTDRGSAAPPSDELSQHLPLARLGPSVPQQLSDFLIRKLYSRAETIIRAYFG